MTSHGAPYGNLVNYTPSHRKTRLSKRSEWKHMNRPACLGTSSSSSRKHHERRFSHQHTPLALCSPKAFYAPLTLSPFDTISAAALRIKSADCCDPCCCCPLSLSVSFPLPVEHHVRRSRARWSRFSPYEPISIFEEKVICININGKITGPFNREVSEVLHIRNPQSDPIAFKVSLEYPCAVPRYRYHEYLMQPKSRSRQPLPNSTYLSTYRGVIRL